MRYRAWIVLCCLVWCGIAGAVEAPASAASSPHLVDDEILTRVWEPVFQGEVVIYEAGRNHRETVVLIHGVGERGFRDFDAVIPSLAEHYHVLAFDLPGFGDSSHQNIRYSPALYAAFVKWAIDRSARPEFSVIGHSFGGAIALRFAATFPHGLKHLVLADVAGVLNQITLSQFMARSKIKPFLPGVSGDFDEDLIRVISGMLIDKTKDLPIDLDLALASEATRDTVFKGNSEAIAAMAMVTEDYTHLMRHISAPTLILWGADDATTPLRTGKILAERIPRARLEVLADVGHVPMKESPSGFVRRVLAELARDPEAKVKTSSAGLPKPGERIGRCSGERGVAFVGGYDHIEISDCQDVRLYEVATRSIVISKSEVEMEKSTVHGEGIAIEVTESFLKATACDVSGATAIKASNSRLDFAGVDIQATEQGLVSPDSSTLIASVCLISSPVTSGSLHDHFVITPKNPL